MSGFSRVCEICGKEFSVRSLKRGKVCCSIACACIKRHGHPIKEKRIVKTPHSAERVANITKANRKPLKASLLKEAKYLLEYKFIGHSLIKEKLNVSSHTYKRICKELNYALNRDRAYTSSLNGWTIEKLLWLEKNVSKFTAHKLNEHLKLSIEDPILRSFCKKWLGKCPKYETKSFHKGPTQPELFMEEVLKKWNVDYVYNKPVEGDNIQGIKQHYTVDFVVAENVFIEIQGDYWHGNPEVYQPEQLNGMQRSARNRDRRKKAFCLQNKLCVHYFTIWENDITNKTERLNNTLEEIRCIVQNKN